MRSCPPVGHDDGAFMGIFHSLQIMFAAHVEAEDSLMRPYVQKMHRYAKRFQAIEDELLVLPDASAI